MQGDPHHFPIFGHRGSPRRLRENTIDSFEGALREGADGFETDLRLLADGVAVLFHDDELNGRPVETLTSAVVPAPRVRDLARFAGHATMILEVKRGNWVDALLQEIGAWQKIVVASFDHSLIAELARRKVHFPLGITVSGVIDTFLLLLIGIGPKLALVPFLGITASLDPADKRRVLRKMLVTAATVATP